VPGPPFAAAPWWDATGLKGERPPSWVVGVCHIKVLIEAGNAQMAPEGILRPVATLFP
jgi:hypothetical protein